METVVRHATEVGARAFVPFASSRSVVRLDASKAARKRDRWSSIARSAAMQSGRGLVPEVSDVKTFQQACEGLGVFDAVVVFWEGDLPARTPSHVRSNPSKAHPTQTSPSW